MFSMRSIPAEWLCQNSFAMSSPRIFTKDLDRVVADRRQMRGGAGGHAFADLPAIDNDHVDVARQQFIGRREAGDAAADNHHAGPFVPVQGFGVRSDLGVRP